MKDIVTKINESKAKFLIKYYIKGYGNDMRYTDHWPALIDKEPVSKAEWWEVYDNSKTNFTEVDSCVAWHGEDSYWGAIINNTENPDDAPSWARKLKKDELEKIKKCEK